MIFVVALAVRRGPVTLAHDTVEGLCECLRETLGEPEVVVDGVGRWAISAKVGDWVDCPRFWVFACAGAAEKIEEPERGRN